MTKSHTDFPIGGPTLLPELDNQFRPLVRMLDQSAIVRLAVMGAALFTLYSVYITTLQVREDLADRKEERAARQEERIERAWSTLRTPGVADTGKGKALDTLIKANHPLLSVDLSCSKVGEPQEKDIDYCPNPPVFSSFDLNPKELQAKQIRQADQYRFLLSEGYDETHFTGGLKRIPDLSGVNLSNFKGENIAYPMELLRGTKIFEGELTESVFIGSDPVIIFETTDLSFSHMTYDIITPMTKSSNVSGVTYRLDISNPPARIQRLFTWMAGSNWAWADLPPMGIDEEGIYPSPQGLLRSLQLCDPVFRKPSVKTEVTKAGYTVISEAKGLSPQYNYNHRLGVCKRLTVEEAAKRFPDRYPDTAMAEAK